MQRMQLDDQDKRALRALDIDFSFSGDGEIASVVGEMEVTVVRPADDDGARFLLMLQFPSGETLEVRIARAQLLEQLGVETKT
jgi:hypothetical protein